MKGLSDVELSRIDVELKEAICDSLVNSLAARVSGMDERGKVAFGTSPRRGIFSAQLLPRFDATGTDDETSDIRIATLGMDFVLSEDAEGLIWLQPRFSVFLRVIPEWNDFVMAGGPLDFDFKLDAEVQREIDERIRAERQPALEAAGVATPKWSEMDEAARAKVRARRAKILGDVRRKAYADHGIKLLNEDEDTSILASEPGGAIASADDALEHAGESEEEIQEAPRPPIARLLREGRSIPPHLIRPAPIPGKWRRLDMELPTVEVQCSDDAETLALKLEKYNADLKQHVRDALVSWAASEGVLEGWRDVKIAAADALSEDKWTKAVQEIVSKPLDPNKVLPDLSGIGIRLHRQPDFLDPARISYRATLENGCSELSRDEAKNLCNAVFGAQLSVIIPRSAHRALRLDRVEPSYRFRDHLTYPAIGLNCGVEAVEKGTSLELRTTMAPRFTQPRIIPRNLDVQHRFAFLKDLKGDPSELLELPRSYSEWIDLQERRLASTVTEGLDADDARVERDRLRDDLAAQRAEAGYIRRGVEVLIESKKACDALPKTGATDNQLQRAAPWRAWCMTNEAFADRDALHPERGWRLFQMAFVLAHIPVFVSRMPEWQDFHDPLLDEDGASLLYFPTGGGKSEAFYGTLIFAMFIDRLRGKDRGITAMVRYPLRLLTLQQAQRLLKLVVRAELVRMKNDVGTWPFEMGFWVGSQNTPNNYAGFGTAAPELGDPDHPDDSRFDASQGDPADRGHRYAEAQRAFNKIPHCPICGQHTGLRRSTGEGPLGKRVVVVCFNKSCDWNTAHVTAVPLPFLLSDDAIYARAPAVVVGTVDKLAMLGQHTATITKVLGMFGLARRIDAHGNLSSPRKADELEKLEAETGCANVFPAYSEGRQVFFDPFPSLIIQDEAHLLEESLGTFSGLFDTLLETVFRKITQIAGDELGVSRVPDRNGLPRMPKVIAATATISSPDRQLEALYQRKPLRFPYPGPDLYHSFFSEPAAPPLTNRARIQLFEELSMAEAPERTSPWMRVYVSLMTNDATHTVTTVGVLAAFHGMITALWDGLLDDRTRDETIAQIGRSITPGPTGDWHRAALDRAVTNDGTEKIMALVDLHRIALAYVTNKKGGDQIIDALHSAVDKEHALLGRPQMGFDSRLISGGVDMTQIQGVMQDAERPFAGIDYPDVTETVRSIVATSAISHGVDVDRFNSMFFAGLPSDIAEYIQASSRVGRTHVGFVMLLPTPQNRRDRYVIETHDIFHRFLERMIAPPAIERWAESAIQRAMASYLQAWAMLEEAGDFLAAPDDQKGQVLHMDQIGRLRNLAKRDPLGFSDKLTAFILAACGFEGRGIQSLGAPHYGEFYRKMVERRAGEFVDDIAERGVSASLVDYWTDQPKFQKPMTSLRDVDEAGMIVAALRDPRAEGSRSTTLRLDDVAEVMRVVRNQRGASSDLDDDGAD